MTSTSDSALPGGVRQRRGGATSMSEMAQELDLFVKVVDDVKEDATASRGILSILCFTLIAVLLGGQIYEFITNTDVEYKFAVDTDYDEKPLLDLDMIIATPCSSLSIMPMGIDKDQPPQQDTGPFGFAAGGPPSPEQENRLKKDPSRFEMSEAEAKLWSTLQKVHKEHFRPGTPLKAVNEMTFMKGSVEEGLQLAADEKQRLEGKELERQREEAAKEKGLANRESSPEHDHAGFVMMVGNGNGFFQIISASDLNGGGSNDKNQGTACRIHGQVPILKGDGDRLTITVGKSLSIGPLVAHIGGHNAPGNISHRIERFHFGPHVWGLVTPLAGNEQIVEKKGVVFKYFVRIVPTRIYGGGTLFSKPKMTYQYSVTYTKKQGAEGEHIHDSIVFDYEFAATVIEVRPINVSLLELLLRLCSLIGGVFATSNFIEALLFRFGRFTVPYSKLLTFTSSSNGGANGHPTKE